MKDDTWSTHALRLGLRQVSGLSEAHGLRIESIRGRGFDSIRDLWLRTRLPPSALEKLADADAFRSLGSTGAMRCGRCAPCSGPATRTICRCLRASPCRNSKPT